jgi:histidinol dehydrogenase
MQLIKDISEKNLLKALQRPALNFATVESAVRTIFKEVEANGDNALKKYTLEFDNVKLDSLKVTDTEIASAKKSISKELKEAIRVAAKNIFLFHAAQAKKEKKITTMTGIECWRESRPIQKVGFYIPGGTAPLFSSVLMLGIPATVAGCKEIYLVSPPNKKGEIHPAILYAASQVGIKNIFKVGGAQAIAALTFGTPSIPSVYKIFGPGNAFVTVAKQFAQQHGVAIDMPAGPSEVMVIADKTANPKFVAADLLSQAEHGPDSQVILVTYDELIIAKVKAEIDTQLALLSRKEFAKQALNNSKIILVKKKEEALFVANFYAPEHLILSVKNTSYFTKNISQAGSVFIGNYSPESVGDYASGTNHVLPTNGFAKSYSGVSVDSFVKKITFQKLTKKGLKDIAQTVKTLATNEGLDAHSNAVSVRLEKTRKQKKKHV